MAKICNEKNMDLFIAPGATKSRFCLGRRSGSGRPWASVLLLMAGTVAGRGVVATGVAAPYKKKKKEKEKRKWGKKEKEGEKREKSNTVQFMGQN